MVFCQQAFGIDRDVRLDQLYHTAWTAKDGAPANVYAFAQTSDGALWLGTEDGLYRFDGVRFMRFYPSAGPALPVGRINSLTVDPDGSLWVGFNPSSVSRIRDGKAVNYTERDGLPGSVRAIAKDRQGFIWAATNSGLVRLEGSRWTVVGSDWHFPPSSCLSVYVDREGRLWVGTTDKLLFLEDGGRKFQVASDHLHNVQDIAESPDGTLWILEFAGMANFGGSVHTVQLPWQYRKSTWSEIQINSESILFDNHGSLWIGTAGKGLRRIGEPNQLYGQKVGQFSPAAQIFTKKDGLTHNYALKLFEDREGDVWVASPGGIDRFRQTPIVPIALPSRTERPTVARGSEGQMWVSTAAGYLGQVTADKFKESHGDSCWAIANGLGGRVWVNCSDAFLRVTGGRIDAFPEPRTPDGNHIASAIAEDFSGAVWVAFWNGGVFRFDKGKWSQFEKRPEETHEVLAAHTDLAGSVWFGRRDGVVEIEEDGKITRMYDEDTVGAGSVFSIQGEGEAIWIGGRSGLTLWDGNRFRKVLPLGRDDFGTVTGIIATQSNGLWLAAGSELIHIDQMEVDRLKANITHRVAMRAFDALDGLPSAFTTWRQNQRAVEGSDGRLWFATQANVFWLDSKRIPRLVAPSTAILSITAGGHEFSASVPLHLPAHTANLKIEYTAWSLSIPERVRFRYRLEGHDTDWQDAGFSRQALYNDLPPAYYKFHVIAANNDGVWNETGDSFSFTIAPAFYQTLWFKALVVVIVCLALWLIYLLRLAAATEKVRARMTDRLAERERIARDLHDTLLQGFQLLTLVFQAAMTHMPSEDPIRETMGRALDQADNVLIEARNSIRNLRAEEETLQSLSEALTEVANQLQQGETVEFNLDCTGEIRLLNPALREDLFRIGKEALINAHQHSGASKIDVNIDYCHDHLEMIIRDNGIGIAQDVLAGGRKGHWGLSGMRERALDIGGQIAFRTDPHAGTEILVTVPGKLAYRASGTLSRWSYLRAFTFRRFS
jgi:signal transduction histidine kinase